MMKIGTSGFRGIIGEEFTKENVVKITQCICDIIKKKNLKRTVVVGYDNRFMSENFAKWICEVLAGNGIQAILTVTSVPSPMTSFAVKILETDFGFMVTSSHNPYIYNGLKIYIKDGKEPDEDLEKILNDKPRKIKKINSMNFDDGVNKKLIEYKKLEKEYVNSIVKFLQFKQNLNKKIAFNVMNGSSLCAVNELKKQLKLTNLDLFNTNRDVSFNFSSPNPFIKENVEDFKKQTKDKDYVFSFATDGDGDRIAVFDEKGVYHDGNEINSLLYYFALSKKGLKGCFIKNYSFSKLVDNVAKNFNEKVIETKVGFKHITKELINNNALFGAENSGCEVNGHVFVKDGLVVFVLLLEIIGYFDKPLSEIFDSFKKEMKYKMFYEEVAFSIKDKNKIIKFLQTNNPCFDKKIVEKGTLDGFKYYFEDGSWVLIRFSGTEDLIRIVAEQNTKKELDKIISKTREIVENI